MARYKVKYYLETSDYTIDKHVGTVEADTEAEAIDVVNSWRDFPTQAERDFYEAHLIAEEDE